MTSATVGSASDGAATADGATASVLGFGLARVRLGLGFAPPSGASTSAVVAVPLSGAALVALGFAVLRERVDFALGLGVSSLAVSLTGSEVLGSASAAASASALALDEELRDRLRVVGFFLVSLGASACGCSGAEGVSAAAVSVESPPSSPFWLSPF